MGKKLNGRLELTKIPKEFIWTNNSGQKSIYIDILERQSPDEYGNTHSVSYYDPKEKKRHYFGSLKIVEYGSSNSQKPSPVVEDEEETDDLPF